MAAAISPLAPTSFPVLPEIEAVLIATDIGWLREDRRWPGLTAIGKVVRIRETAAKTTTETAYYLLGLSPESPQ